MIIQTNIPALIAGANYNINNKSKTKSAEKLSSGYRINRAADDAAGLSISETMRAQIRGLNQGTRNAENGISWVHVGEGALNEVHDMLHRMSELAIQSLNDTNTPEDRATLQAEFDELQSEIDKITDTTQFNTKNIFSDHEPVFYQMEGNLKWNQSAAHVIDSSMNSLTVSYKADENSQPLQVTVSVPEGVYTTQELIDEIDDAMTSSGAAAAGINLEYTENGTCNLNIEGGYSIESVSGGLSYLLNDTYTGGSMGALIGTTIFTNDVSQLGIVSGQNDQMSFQIQKFDGSVQNISITIPEGRYTRMELIDILNNNLSGTTVEAVKYGKSIKLQSDDSVITGFKGNMFKVDGNSGTVYTSVFYDNVRYGSASQSSAVFTGGAVITSSGSDAKHNHFTIDSSNDTLRISANGGSEVTLTIPHGEYNVAEMATKLNTLFAGNNLELKAELYRLNDYYGLKITSLVKGLNSSVNIDRTSDAYATLFTDRRYNIYGAKAVVSYENRDDINPVLTGGKSFSDMAQPFTVAAGQNDMFALKLGSVTYNITIAARTYSSAVDLVPAIDDALNGSGAIVAYKDKVSVSADSQGRIVLTGNSGNGLTDIGVQAVTGNNGYSDVFVGEKVTYRQVTASGNGSVTLNTPVDDLASLAGESIDVIIDGIKRPVTIPSDADTYDEIIDSINSQLEEKHNITLNTFSDINAYGRTISNDVSASASGSTSVTNKSFNNTGVTVEDEGIVGAYKQNTPARVVLDKNLDDTTLIESTNNSLQLAVKSASGTKNVNITIASGSYSKNGLVNAIQAQLNSKLGSGYGGVKVSLDGSKLSFESVITDSEGNVRRGDETSISMSTDSSSFLRELYTTRTSARAVSSGTLQRSIDIDDNNNKFIFTYNDGSGNRNIELTLGSGHYDRNGIVAEINRQLNLSAVPVTVSLSSDRLVLATDGKGSGYRISYSNRSGGSSAEALFGPFESFYPAGATANRDIQQSITITDDTSGFNIKVNGTDYNITLDCGTYTRSEFVSMLNEKFLNAGAGVTASLTGNRITYTTSKSGSSASIKMSYSGGGSSMLPIYGQTDTVTPGATASFNADKKLVLTGTGGTEVISVTSKDGSRLQAPEKIVTTVGPQAESGYISTKHSYIDGVDITEPVTIDRWNDTLGFRYSHAGTSENIVITLGYGTYTFEQLRNELQSKADAAMGVGQVTVTVNNSGVRIENNNVGSKYVMNGFGGSFYDNVLCHSEEKQVNVATAYKAGGQYVDSAFTIGRRDIRNDTFEISNGINDTLTFDLTFGGSSYTITVNLDDGTYGGSSLVSALQGKINEQLTAAGLPGNMVKAQIGGVNTGVSGANDANALCLTINSDVALPAEGQYVIDGVRGNAAFTIFYQSDGKMIPAYTTGSRDLTDGAELTSENNQFSFDVDGTGYDITIPEGRYTADELIDSINRELNDGSVPVTAKLEDGKLKLQYKSYGKHVIDNVSGTARESIFFQTYSANSVKDTIKIQLSGNAGDSKAGRGTDGEAAGRDYIAIDRTVLNTVKLGINSIAITKPKYANKALERISGAVSMVSSIRSELGAVENRLEHAINGNDNTAENLQSSESLIRDSDMADEEVRYAKFSILEQASQAILAQANTTAQGVLNLLK